MKRALDVAASAAGLLLLAPLFAAVAAWIKLDSRGPVFFRQLRIGKDFKPFLMYKFRTMNDAPGPPITFGKDPRITRAGGFLRRMKIDELPQLVNVLLGDMSLVGPRPELPAYVERFREDFAQVLRVRPGITDWASLKYRDEAALLGRARDPEREYIRSILPDKIRLAKEYVRRASVAEDLRVLFSTLRALIS